jgi:hypothetical protein
VSGRPALPLRLAGLHLLVLWSFAVAQPLFDLLGKNAEFFAARGSTRWDAVGFALVLLFVPPALLLGLEWVAGPARRWVHAVLVAGLLALFVLGAIRDAGGPGRLLLLVAATAGAAGAWLYVRHGAARMALTVLAPAPLLFLALFLFNSDVSRLSVASDAHAAAERPRAPVVLVVFDELPLNSLLDARGRIDGTRFPAFARFARGSTWYSRATTVAEGTTHAVPAILTGQLPRAGELPTYADHPQNLFTLLGGATTLHVDDEETHLCPPQLCRGLEGSFTNRVGTLADDTGIVYLHQLLPDDLVGWVPSIANGWDDFLRDASGHHDPGRIDPRFLDSLRPRSQPALWYLHLMLPHSPWRYLPSGERYDVPPAPGWGPDEVWDAGQKRRPLSPANLQDIAYVPLFVKPPGRPRGRDVQTLARTIDVVPTIADAVGFRIPWHVDGHSLLRPRPAGGDVILTKDGGQRFTVPTAALDRLRAKALRRQLRLFGSDGPLTTLFAVGPDRGLLGHAFDGSRRVERLDPVRGSGPLVQVSGREGRARSVAVVAGGRVVAVAPVAGGRFWALVPRKALGHAPRVYAVGD